MAMYYSDSSSYGNSDDYSDNGDSLVECKYCDTPVKERNYQRHIANVHRCPYCPNVMKKKLIQGHIERKHTVQCKHCSVKKVVNEIGAHEATHFTPCKYCPENILKQNMEKHVAENHSIDAIIGMIQLQKITVSRFKELVAQNRIDVNTNGFIFITPQ